MVATVLNLPKWLLAAVVFCIVVGHFQQVECKLTGCASASGEVGAKTLAENDSSPSGETGHCDCQCHFNVASFEVPCPFAVLRFARQVRLTERSISVPEVPCAEIEYPPRFVRA